MVMPYMALYLRERFGFELLEAGWLLSAWGVGAGIGAQLGGWLTDRIGHVRVQVASLALGGLGFLAIARLDSFGALAVGLFLHSVVSEAARPAAAAGVAAYTRPLDRPRAYALLRLALNLGFTLGPAVGGFLAEVDFMYLFWVNAVLWLCSAALLGHFARGWVPLPEETRVEATPRDRSPWRDPVLLVVFVLTCSHGFVFAQMQAAWPIYIEEGKGLARRAIGGLFAVNTVLILLFEMLLIDAVKRLRPLVPVALGVLLVGLGYGLTPFGHGFAGIAVTVAIWTAGEMLFAPMLSTFVANRAGPAHRGRAMGMFTLAWAVALAAAPVLGTWAYQAHGAGALWAGCFVLCAMAAAGYLLLDRGLRRDEPEAS